MKLIKRAVSFPSFIFIFAFAFRIAMLCWGQHNERLPIVPPSFGYETGRIARSIALGKGFSSPLNNLESGPTIWLTPIYPYLLAGIFKLFGVYSYASNIIAAALNLLFAALTCFPIYYAGKRVAGAAVAVGAAWMWVFLPLAIMIPIQWIWDTSLTALLSAAILWATLEIRDSQRTRDWILYGLLWGAGLMVNAALLSLMPFLLGWLIWERRKQTLPWFRATVFAIVTMCLCCVPWTIRNYVVFHEFVVFRSNFGLELWLGNNKDVPDTWTGDLHPNDDWNERMKYLHMGELAYMREKQHEAIHFMVTHPADVTRFFWRRFADTWTLSWESLQGIWGRISPSARLILSSNLIEVFFGFFGLYLLARQKNPYMFPVASYPLFFPAVYYVTHPSWRYRHPIDPVMMVLAAYGIACVVRAPFRRKSTSHASPIASGIPSNEGSVAL
jgi:4-amino-4-deoxy-L-arabinose transferase-like glycosyltransferase